MSCEYGDGDGCAHQDTLLKIGLVKVANENDALRYLGNEDSAYDCNDM